MLRGFSTLGAVGRILSGPALPGYILESIASLHTYATYRYVADNNFVVVSIAM